MKELVIASSNSHKVLQIREFLKELVPHVTLLSLFDFPEYCLPAYDPAKSFQENACIKAQDAASNLNRWAIAEQWGLVIPVLQEQTSTIFGNEQNLTPAQLLVSQTKKILALMKGKSEYERAAFLESCVACASPSGKLKKGIGRVEGSITDSERGKGSFEFDTIFVKHDYMKTLAELSESVRSRISHRKKALEKLIGFLQSLD